MSGFLSPVLQMVQCLISVVYAWTPYHCVSFPSSMLHPYLERPGTGGASPALQPPLAVSGHLVL